MTEGRRSEHVSHAYTSQRLQLRYVEWGPPDAEPLILLHGARDHCRSWDWLVQALGDRWRVIAPDLRGHGDSEWTSDGGYDMASLVFDLAELVRHLGLASVKIVAHSLGGAVAVRFAAFCLGKVDRLVTIEGLSQGRGVRDADGSFSATKQMLHWMKLQRDIAERAPKPPSSLADAAVRMRRSNPRLTQEQAAHLARHGVRLLPDGGYAWKFDPGLRAMAPDDITVEEVRALWGQITCPVLMIYGRDSWASNPAADGRMAHFGNARLFIAEGAGHWVHHDRLDLVAAELRAFLELRRTRTRLDRGRAGALRPQRWERFA